MVIFFLLVFLLGPHLLKHAASENIFSASGKLSWWVAASSMLIIYWNPTLDMVNTRLVIDKGYSGLWFLKDALLTLGIAPVFFAPMWSRLKFTTDNQLIRLRFSGKGAKILQQFRAIYVGVFIASFLCSFFLLGVKKIVSVSFSLDSPTYAAGFAVVTLLLVLKNSLQKKLRTDVLVTLLYLLVPVVCIGFLVQGMGGWSSMKTKLMSQHFQQLTLLPGNSTENESVGNIIVFLGVQWWSARILDQSNPNAQRFFALNDPFQAFRALFLPAVILSLTFGLSSLVWDASLLIYEPGMEKESLYIRLLMLHAPEGLRGLVFIVLILGFLTSYESILNWGASLVVVDVFQQGLNLRFSKRSLDVVSYLIMGLIAVFSVLITLYSKQLINLQKLFFSMGAGVGVIFILRWFWWRINAWAQLTAMVSSLIFTFGYDYLVSTMPAFAEVTGSWQAVLNLDPYPLKLVILTVLTTLTWLLVMYVTPPDREEHLRKFVQATGTGGAWNNLSIPPFHFWKKAGLALLFAASALLPLFFIWQLKFGSYATGGLMLVGWLGITLFIYVQSRQFSRVWKEKAKQEEDIAIR